MKLLVDQNLSLKLVNKLQTDFPFSVHVKDVNLQESSDMDIWNYAKENNYAIVTQDADFYDIALLKGPPPQIIWIRAGNKSTDFLTKLLKKNVTAIKSFLKDKQRICLEIL